MAIKYMSYSPKLSASLNQLTKNQLFWIVSSIYNILGKYIGIIVLCGASLYLFNK